MKILHIVNFFLPDKVAGTEYYVFFLSKELMKLGFTCEILRPDYDDNASYQIEGIKVNYYKENSISSKLQKLGLKAPGGLENFRHKLEEISPSIVHFHEINGSNGITIFHIEMVKKLGFKSVFTMHLSNYSCNTGNLMFKDIKICDGITENYKCTQCTLAVKHGTSGYLNKSISTLTNFVFRLDLLSHESVIKNFGFLGLPWLIRKKQLDLFRVVDNTSVIVSITEWYKTILVKNGVKSEQIQIIKQGIFGEPLLKDEKDSLPVRAGNLRLVFIGRVIKFKGLDILIKALLHLNNNEITLDVYGQIADDKYYDECLKLANGIPSIRWCGTIPSADVIVTLREYDCLVLPSTFSEMSPLVIQEAFAAGIPVIASNVYGNIEQVIDGVNGLTFEFRSVSDLSSKIDKLFSNRNLIDKFKKNIRFPSTFNIIAQQYKNVYLSIPK